MGGETSAQLISLFCVQTLQQNSLGSLRVEAVWWNWIVCVPEDNEMRRIQSDILFNTGLRKLLVRDYGTFELNFLGETGGIESSLLLLFFFDVIYWIHFNLSFKSQQQIPTRCLQPVSMWQQKHHGDKPTMSVSTSFFILPWCSDVACHIYVSLMKALLTYWCNDGWVMRVASSWYQQYRWL